MPRKKKQFDYNDVFPTRLRFLIGERDNTTQDILAEAIGVTRQTVGNWCSGDSSPDAVCLKAIADYFDVSIDWMLRENAPQKVNADLSAVCNYTNLNEKAITAITSDSMLADFINEFIPTEYAEKVALSLSEAGVFIRDACDIIDEKSSRNTPIENIYEAFRLNRFEAVNEFTLFVNGLYRKYENHYRKKYALVSGNVVRDFAEMKSDCISLDCEGTLNGKHNETQK